MASKETFNKGYSHTIFIIPGLSCLYAFIGMFDLKVESINSLTCQQSKKIRKLHLAMFVNVEQTRYCL